MGSGPYTVTPSKVGGVVPFGTTITGFDSAQIASHVVGNITLNATQLQVADVSGAGGVTSFDAALIARWVASLPGSGSTANWIFSPVNRSYPNVNTNQTGQDYTALLMGDVSGNWSQATTRPAPVDPNDGVLKVGAPEMTTASGEALRIPISIGDTSGLGIVAYQFELRYDSTVITPAEDVADIAGTLSEGRVVTVNSDEPGVLRVAAFGSQALSGKGDLLGLRFNTVGSIDAETSLTLEKFLLNEGGIDFKLTDGKLRIASDTKKGAILRGHLLTGTGDAVAAMRVAVVDSNGNTRSAMTNAAGYFEVPGLRAGETYTVSVSSGRLRFDQQTVIVGESGYSIDLIAKE